MAEIRANRCGHEESLWGRCIDCGMTWAQQADLYESGVRLAAEGFTFAISTSGVREITYVPGEEPES